VAKISQARRLRVEFKRRTIIRQSREMKRLFNKELVRLFNEILRNLGIRRAPVEKQDLSDIPGLFDTQRWINTISTSLGVLTGGAYRSNLLDRESNIGFAMASESKDVLTAQFISESELSLANFAANEAARIRDAVADRISQGLTGRDLSRSIEDLFDNISSKRAEVIVRNQAAKAYSTGRTDFWNTVAPEAPKFKRWLPSIGAMDLDNHHPCAFFNLLIT